ncbi:NUDIX hydrolase [Pedobacter sp. AW1-32]|uniref:NUDIX hydrolase n=1 Tax=Pedobacter sp. AW1-32 TaxID=3383026 RepID=UPI003FEFF017
MEDLQIFEARSEQFYKNNLPHISIDCVVFGFHEHKLKVLLVKLKGQGDWGLPGGYLRKNENIDAAAERILKERTGADKIFLQQFKTFGEINRSENTLNFMPEGIWFRQRFLSIGYYALVNYADIIPVVDDISVACEWQDIDSLSVLMMDHQQIYDTALETLRLQLNYKPIGYNLLPEEFTMPELQRLYEAILGKELLRGNFQRKMLSYGIFNKLNKERRGGAHRSPHIYSFDVEKYQNAIKKGLKGDW